MISRRKFDWDEARRLRREGWSYTAIGDRFGVSHTAVRLACDAEARARSARQAAAWQAIGQGVCEWCGGPRSHNPAQRRGIGVRYCRACAALVASARRADVVMRADTLLCADCDEWKPDASFAPHHTIARRGRRAHCRDCDTARKRDYRARKALEATL